MLQSPEKQLRVCTSQALAEKQFLIVDLQYKGAAHSGIVFRFHGQAYAYLNQCVHMPRRLNCERDTVFDDKQEKLRCSMHGIVYDPVTGESLSTMCQGEKLQALRIFEDDGYVFIRDKRVRPLLPVNPGETI
ncbi:MAG: Rieske 2Fe-2S domain-containing protein [Chromatiales bacterium]|jgi:nitrite reductase/ring-hydroxylating ferredoxin subunit